MVFLKETNEILKKNQESLYNQSIKVLEAQKLMSIGQKEKKDSINSWGSQLQNGQQILRKMQVRSKTSIG